jgi:hypothetical protein
VSARDKPVHPVRREIPWAWTVRAHTVGAVQRDAEARALTSLRQNGRMDIPQNEAEQGTYLDLAVHAVLPYAIYRSEVSA